MSGVVRAIPVGDVWRTGRSLLGCSVEALRIAWGLSRRSGRMGEGQAGGRADSRARAVLRAGGTRG
ncbi:hypothetical protein, partial [Streptomyces sp. NPDC007000]|uniref:hypothetical protein n=1 Tax=Streptomyces sp. NPDC007000 TaxID=3155357 RepID=UPI0034110024